MRKLPPFTVISASTVAEACQLRANVESSAFYAGGTEMLLAMKLGVMRYELLIDIKPIQELRTIERTDGGALDIGADVTHREVERSLIVREAVPVLSDVARRVGNVRVRSSGTIGGNLAFAEPRSDIATVGLCLDARVELAAPDETRRWVNLEDFFVGPYTTHAETTEILTRLQVILPGEEDLVRYDKFQFNERPTVSVGVALHVTGDHVVGSRIAIGAAVPKVTRARQAEDEAVGDLATLTERIGSITEAATADLEITDELDGSADYKAHLVRVLLDRMLRGCVGPKNAIVSK